MRLLVNLLVVVAALCLLLGGLTAFFGRATLYVALGGILPYWGPETWWRGAVALLMFAVTFLLVERRGRS